MEAHSLPEWMGGPFPSPLSAPQSSDTTRFRLFSSLGLWHKSEHGAFAMDLSPAQAWRAQLPLVWFGDLASPARALVPSPVS